jgi:chemotaxis protein histidine kinase CheA
VLLSERTSIQISGAIEHSVSGLMVENRCLDTQATSATLVPFRVHIAHLFDLKTENNNKSYALIVGGTNGVGIIVDRILGEREIVVRALHDPLVQVPGIAGASELGDGRVILILDVAALTRIAK